MKKSQKQRRKEQKLLKSAIKTEQKHNLYKQLYSGQISLAEYKIKIALI